MSAPGELSGFIHRFFPADEVESGPTLLLLHGTGGNETDLVDLGRQLAPGAALLSPRGKVMENGAPRYFRRIAEGVFDLEDLRNRTYELADFVGAAVERYRFAAERIVAVGFSNGANIAASILLLRPEVLAGAVLFRPMVPLIPEPLPQLRGRPVLLAAGRRDPIVSPDETERLRRLLGEAGASVTLHCEPKAGHALTPADVAVARGWLQEWATARAEGRPGRGGKEAR
jgi:predicted esterase